MGCRTLIDAETLKANLGRKDWRVFDCRCSPTEAGAGLRAYGEGHIPFAGYADLDRVLSSSPTTCTGRHPLPRRNVLVDWLAREGVGGDTFVVAYDDDTGAYAARLWWLIRWLGHASVAVLDGGLGAWRSVNGGLEQGPIARWARVEFPVREPLAEAVNTEDILEIVEGVRPGLLVDARAGERYRAESEPIDSAPGHIPGAISRPFAGNLCGGRFRSRGELRRRFAGLAQGPENMVHYCGSGVTACHNVLAMEHAGLPGSKLYPGSWSEWIRHPARPIACGGSPHGR